MLTAGDAHQLQDPDAPGPHQSTGSSGAAAGGPAPGNRRRLTPNPSPQDRRLILGKRGREWAIPSRRAPGVSGGRMSGRIRSPSSPSPPVHCAGAGPGPLPRPPPRAEQRNDSAPAHRPPGGRWGRWRPHNNNTPPPPTRGGLCYGTCAQGAMIRTKVQDRNGGGLPEQRALFCHK